MSFKIADLPSVNINLYDQIDDAAIDAATEFELRLSDVGINISDDLKEEIYQAMLRAGVCTVTEDF